MFQCGDSAPFQSVISSRSSTHSLDSSSTLSSLSSTPSRSPSPSSLTQPHGSIHHAQDTASPEISKKTDPSLMERFKYQSQQPTLVPSVIPSTPSTPSLDSSSTQSSLSPTRKDGLLKKQSVSLQCKRKGCTKNRKRPDNVFCSEDCRTCRCGALANTGTGECRGCAKKKKLKSPLIRYCTASLCRNTLAKKQGFFCSQSCFRSSQCSECNEQKRCLKHPVGIQRCSLCIQYSRDCSGEFPCKSCLQHGTACIYRTTEYEEQYVTDNKRVERLVADFCIGLERCLYCQISSKKLVGQLQCEDRPCKSCLGAEKPSCTFLIEARVLRTWRTVQGQKITASRYGDIGCKGNDRLDQEI